ncbi:MAG TPA: P-loop NTPase [Vicinamibacteria bacterium]|nr:P-loop NTPase [Vicinamibacteria bacterium]
MTRVRGYHELPAEEGGTLPAQIAGQRARVQARLAFVGSVVAVMSGKGGVGKSLVAAGLAAALARAGRRVGVLDADLHAPTAARMLGAPRVALAVGPAGVAAAKAPCGVRVMSSDLLLPDEAPLRWREPEQAGFVWRGALETGMLREFLSDVEWGALDELLVDLPPGTERLSALAELVPGLAGAVVVTIPSEASYRAVRRAIEAAQGAGVRLLGIVENMAQARCPGCGAASAGFAGDAGEHLQRESGAPLLARIPFDPRLQAIDQGSTEAVAGALAPAAQALVARLER